MKMGLLEIDPNNPQAAAQQRALLALASGLLSTPGSFGRGIGASLPGLLSAYDGTMQQARQSKLQDAQFQQAQLGLQSGKLGLSREQISLEQAREAQARQKQMQGLAQQFARTPQQQAMSANGGPTVAAANAAQTTAPGFDFAGYANALAGIDPAASLGMQAALRKDDAPIVLPDGAILSTRAGQSLLENKKVAPTSDIGKLIGEMQALPQGHPMRPVYADAIRKATTHAPASSQNVNVSMDKGFGDVFAKQAATNMQTSAESARAAAASIKTLDRVASIMDSAGANGLIIGPGANAETVIRQVGEKLGIAGNDNAEKLARSRELVQSAAQLGMDGAKALQGQGQITDFERRLIDKAAGGDLQSITAPEVRQLIGALRKVNVAKVAAHAVELQKVPSGFNRYTPMYQVPAPDPQPTGQPHPTGQRGRVIDFGNLK